MPNRPPRCTYLADSCAAVRPTKRVKANFMCWPKSGFSNHRLHQSRFSPFFFPLVTLNIATCNFLSFFGFWPRHIHSCFDVEFACSLWFTKHYKHLKKWFLVKKIARIGCLWIFRKFFFEFFLNSQSKQTNARSYKFHVPNSAFGRGAGTSRRWTPVPSSRGGSPFQAAASTWWPLCCRRWTWTSRASTCVLGCKRWAMPFRNASLIPFSRFRGFAETVRALEVSHWPISHRK